MCVRVRVRVRVSVCVCAVLSQREPRLTNPKKCSMMKQIFISSVIPNAVQTVTPLNELYIHSQSKRILDIFCSLDRDQIYSHHEPKMPSLLFPLGNPVFCFFSKQSLLRCSHLKVTERSRCEGEGRGYGGSAVFYNKSHAGLRGQPLAG